MLTSGDVVAIDLGTPRGREAGMSRPAVVVTAQRVLEREPTVIHVVPLTSRLRKLMSEIEIEPDPSNGLSVTSAAQCHQIRAVSVGRVDAVLGNVGPVALAEIKEMISLLLDIR